MQVRFGHVSRSQMEPGTRLTNQSRTRDFQVIDVVDRAQVNELYNGINEHDVADFHRLYPNTHGEGDKLLLLYERNAPNEPGRPQPTISAVSFNEHDGISFLNLKA